MFLFDVFIMMYLLIHALFQYWISENIDEHYDDVIMTMLASQITSLTVVYSIVYSGVDQSKHQSSASLAFVQEIHRGPVNFPHKWPVTRKMFPFDDVIMKWTLVLYPRGPKQQDISGPRKVIHSKKKIYRLQVPSQYQIKRHFVRYREASKPKGW